MTLPYDFTRCLTAGNGTCPLRNTCARWVDPVRPDGPQSFMAYAGGKDCRGYIKADDE